MTLSHTPYSQVLADIYLSCMGRCPVYGVWHTVTTLTVILRHSRRQKLFCVPFNKLLEVERAELMWHMHMGTGANLLQCMSSSLFLVPSVLSACLPALHRLLALRLSCALQGVFSFLHPLFLGHSPQGSHVLIQVHGKLNSRLNILSESLSGLSMRGLIMVSMPVGRLSSQRGGDGCCSTVLLVKMAT